MTKPTHRLTNVDRELGWGDCSQCGQVKLKFSGSKGLRVHCSHAATLSRSRLNALNSGGYHPLVATKAELDAGLVAQQGRCAVCEKPTPSLVPDHCHETGGFRGWLCPKCNVALGMLDDRLDLAESAAEYLRLTSRRA